MTFDWWIIIKGFILLNIIDSSECIFFQYPKKGLVDFLQSLGGKEEIFKKTKEEVHHYYLHYYPVPLFVEKERKIAENHGHLETIHREKENSANWNDQGYHYDPPWSRHPGPGQGPRLEAKGHVIDDQFDIVGARHESIGVQQRSPVASQSPLMMDHRRHRGNNNGIVLVQLPPLQHEIVVRHPVTTEERKKKEIHPFIAFVKKLQRIKTEIFRAEDEPEEIKRPEKVPSAITLNTKFKLGQIYGAYLPTTNPHVFR